MQNFDLLTPHVVAQAVEEAYDLRTDGTISALSSYVNRVYALTDEEGNSYVAKFYRPGRWSREAILEEHDLVLECAAADLPVVAPIVSPDGNTLEAVVAADEEHETEFACALYPKRAGRNFDAERDEDLLRLGSLVGRLHAVAARKEASRRLRCSPDASTTLFLEELREVVHPELREEFFEVAAGALERITPLFAGARGQRIHGDCHRGNILDRGAEGLLLIDFDDMMMGPPVQDLWLLLPDRARKSRRELALILEGYEQFHTFERSSLALIEPLRLMRMIYYLAWSARQRDDRRFREGHPDWGTRAFWLKEIEDLRDQIRAIEQESD